MDLWSAELAKMAANALLAQVRGGWGATGVQPQHPADMQAWGSSHATPRHATAQHSTPAWVG
jgi:hypothetical protein